jgi:DNA repair ATPase RecN
MDVNFINAYSEVLTENFDAVIKQNMLLQARLKLNDKEAERFKDTTIQLQELQAERKELLDKIELLNATVVRTENVRYKANENDSLAAEKSRIQVALNESMKEAENLKKEIDTKAKQFKETTKSKDQKISELENYIKTLEELLPASKLKKVNPEAAAAKVQPVVKEEVKATEQPQIDELNTTIVQSGGTF